MRNGRSNKNVGSPCDPEDMIRTPAIDIDKEEIREIPIEKIQVSEFCRRSNYNDIDPLVQSIEKNRLFQPGGVIDNGDGTYTLIFGSRRLEAHKRLGKRTFWRRVFDATAEQAAVLSLADNVATKNMHPVEQARKLRSQKVFNAESGRIA